MARGERAVVAISSFGPPPLLERLSAEMATVPPAEPRSQSICSMLPFSETVGLRAVASRRFVAAGGGGRRGRAGDGAGAPPRPKALPFWRGVDAGRRRAAAAEPVAGCPLSGRGPLRVRAAPLGVCAPARRGGAVPLTALAAPLAAFGALLACGDGGLASGCGSGAADWG